MTPRQAPGFSLQRKIRFAVDKQKFSRTTACGLGNIYRRKGDVG